MFVAVTTSVQEDKREPGLELLVSLCIGIESKGLGFGTEKFCISKDRK